MGKEQEQPVCRKGNSDDFETEESFSTSFMRETD